MWILPRIYRCILSFYFYRWVYSRFSRGSSSKFTISAESYMHTSTNTCKGYFGSLAPDRGSGSINYISAPAIKQGYYQAAARRPGKAWPIKACCDVRAVARSCDSNREWQLMLSRDGRMEREKMGIWGRIQKKKGGKKGVCGSNNRISVNYPSSALYLHLHFNLWRARKTEKIIHHYFMKHPDRICLSKYLYSFIILIFYIQQILIIELTILNLIQL